VSASVVPHVCWHVHGCGHLWAVLCWGCGGGGAYYVVQGVVQGQPGGCWSFEGRCMHCHTHVYYSSWNRPRGIPQHLCRSLHVAPL
jgi:hypothetical protein